MIAQSPCVHSYAGFVNMCYKVLKREKHGDGKIAAKRSILQLWKRFDVLKCSEEPVETAARYRIYSYHLIWPLSAAIQASIRSGILAIIPLLVICSHSSRIA